MKRTKLRMWICIVLLCIVLIFIWGNSCLPAEQSRAFSLWVRNLIAPLFGWPIVTKPSKGGPSVLRKVAHFTEFSWLGLGLSWLVHMLRAKKAEIFLMTLSAGAAAAFIDEGIQFFIPGRAPGLKDVGIDTMGVLLGIGIITLIAYINQRKNKKCILEEQIQ